MTLLRRRFFKLVAGAVALPIVTRTARAQVYPTRPVRLIVGFAPGSITDTLARLMGQWLSQRFKQPFVIDNRPGAGSNIATEAVVKAPPDGHTLLIVGPPNAINATLYDKLNFNFIRDIAPVASMVRQPQIMLLNPAVPARTVPEFIAYARSSPGKLNMASPGTGTGPHIAGELFKMMAGVDMTHVPYRGAALAITDLLGGQVQVMFSGPVGLLEYIQSGRLRALAVTTASPADVLPDLPTVGSFVPGYESSGWFGVGAPKNTPRETIETLNREINVALSDPAMRRRLADLGVSAFALSPTEFAAMIAAETEKWAKVVKFSGAKPD